MRNDSPSTWSTKNELPGAQASLVSTLQSLFEKYMALVPQLMEAALPFTADAAAKGVPMLKDPR